MGFFDFLANMPHYQDRTNAVARMNMRHTFLVAAHADTIAGARVLDLGAHDGRWSYAFAGAGAAHVTGIEARAELVATFSDYPDPTLRARVDLRVGDIFEELQNAVAAGESYDVVAIFGILYHIIDHFRLFQLVVNLRPKLIIVDSEFIQRSNGVIVLGQERTDKILNASAQYPGQKMAVVGTPSPQAVVMMADVLGYDVIWADLFAIPEADRHGGSDYFRDVTEKKVRAACVLKPRAQ